MLRIGYVASAIRGGVSALTPTERFAFVLPLSGGGKEKNYARRREIT